MGGLALLDVDVWGSFEHGALPALTLALRRGLLRPGGALVTFACSDLAARLHHGATPVATALDIVRAVQDACAAVGRHCTVYPWPAEVANHVSYARTMQLHGFLIR